jgi:hypothetical protein
VACSRWPAWGQFAARYDAVGSDAKRLPPQPRPRQLQGSPTIGATASARLTLPWKLGIPARPAIDRASLRRRARVRWCPHHPRVGTCSGYSTPATPRGVSLAVVCQGRIRHCGQKQYRRSSNVPPMDSRGQSSLPRYRFPSTTRHYQVGISIVNEASVLVGSCVKRNFPASTLRPANIHRAWPGGPGTGKCRKAGRDDLR